MNLHEIETVLKTLISHHSDLTEAKLLVLLQAGGWEEKTIKEALVLFRTIEHTATPSIEVVAPRESVQALPHEELIVLPTPVDESHRIEQKVSITNTEVLSVDKNFGQVEIVHEEKKVVPEVVQEKKIENNVSLIEREEFVPPPKASPVVETGVSVGVSEPVTKIRMEKTVEQVPEPVTVKGVVAKKVEIPENLPLKLYDFSPHAVPFSQYKEMVYDTMEEGQGEVLNSGGEKNSAEEVSPAKANTSSFEAETKLVILASVMLLTIMLLLGYMYTNGRL